MDYLYTTTVSHDCFQTVLGAVGGLNDLRRGVPSSLPSGGQLGQLIQGIGKYNTSSYVYRMYCTVVDQLFRCELSDFVINRPSGRTYCQAG
jgi:hypothetical protein